jgi:uncharacterized SAM-binding protein YcdF (DUF218 family)
MQSNAVRALSATNGGIHARWLRGGDLAHTITSSAACAFDRTFLIASPFRHWAAFRVTARPQHIHKSFECAMTYYVSKVFWILAAPTSALVLISAGAGLWALLGGSNCAAWLSAGVGCGLFVGAFTPIGLALTVPLENRFPFSRLDPQVLLDGIIMLPGGAGNGVDALSKLSQDYPKARLTFCGFGAAGENLVKRLADLGIDPSRVKMQSQSRTTSEDAFYAAALLRPKPNERWMLITAAMHMPRAVGCFRVVGFRVEPYPVEFMTRGRSGRFALFGTGSLALSQFDRAAKEWIGLIAYRIMGKTDALFPGP